MAITKEQQEVAIRHLNEKLTLTCPSCGARRWRVGDIINAMPYEEGAVVIGGRTVPLLLVVCEVCAFVAHFAAVPMGLVGKKG